MFAKHETILPIGEADPDFAAARSGLRSLRCYELRGRDRVSGIRKNTEPSSSSSERLHSLFLDVILLGRNPTHFCCDRKATSAEKSARPNPNNSKPRLSLF
jgi:hypothetical protein